EGAQLLHRGAQLAAWGRLVPPPLRRSRAGPGRVLAELHGLPTARRRPRADALAPARGPADLSDPRPGRADRRPLGTQLREAPRARQPALDPPPPPDFLPGAEPVLHAARAVPEGL